MDPDPDSYWIRIRIGIQPKMLDSDPDEMNADSATLVASSHVDLRYHKVRLQLQVSLQPLHRHSTVQYSTVDIKMETLPFFTNFNCKYVHDNTFFFTAPLFDSLRQR